MSALPQAANAGGTPSVKTTVHISTSARAGTCTATVTVRWSGYNVTDGVARIVDNGGYNFDKHPSALSGSRGSFKETFTAVFDVSANNNVRAEGAVYDGVSWQTDDSTTYASIPCAAGSWS